jgi:hypothetical protein
MYKAIQKKQRDWESEHGEKEADLDDLADKFRKGLCVIQDKLRDLDATKPYGPCTVDTLRKLADGKTVAIDKHSLLMFLEEVIPDEMAEYDTALSGVKLLSLKCKVLEAPVLLRIMKGGYNYMDESEVSDDDQLRKLCEGAEDHVVTTEWADSQIPDDYMEPMQEYQVVRHMPVYFMQEGGGAPGAEGGGGL